MDMNYSAETADDQFNGNSTSFTSLDQILKQISAYPLLSAEEEKELAAAANSGDSFARDRMIKCNLRLVMKVIKKYVGLGLDPEDLFIEGSIGLCNAISHFDFERGYRFSTCAVPWIKQAVVRSINKYGSAIRLPENRIEERSHLLKASRTLERVLGRKPTEEETASEIGFSIKKVRDLSELPHITVSTDSPYTEDGEMTFGDIYYDAMQESIEEIIEHTETSHELQSAILSLNENERYVIINRFFFNGKKPTRASIGDSLGISGSRINQIEQEAIKKLKRFLHEHYSE